MALSGSTARPNNIVGTFGSAIDPAVSDAAARHCPRRSRTPRPKRSVRSARSAFAATLLSPSLATAGKASAEPSFGAGVVLKPRSGNPLPNRATRTISGPILGVECSPLE
jgi:hypothetical protein